MENQKLVMIVVGSTKYVGKVSEIDTNQSIVTLHDAIQCIDVMGQGGMAILGAILGEVELSTLVDHVYIELNNKSPYYNNYFQTNSNLHLAASQNAMQSPKKH